MNACRILAKAGQASEALALVQSALKFLPAGHEKVADLRGVKRWLLQKYPFLEQLASSHTQKKDRNRRKRR